MTEQQVFKLVAVLVEHQSAFATLPTEDAQWVIQNAKPAIAVFIEAIKNRPQPFELLLEPVGMVVISMTVEPFVAHYYFVQDTTESKVKVSFLGSNFKSWFLSKIEKPFSGSTLRFGKLRESATDGRIIDKLGGKEKAETALGELWGALEKQPNGEKGDLLVNGCANIFYIRDKNGVLRAVRVRWSDVGWDVDAFSVVDTRRWLVGCQVFFRTPVYA